MKNKRYDLLADSVNRYLESIFVEKHVSYSDLYDAMSYSVLNGGKRLRGVLMLEFARICGLDPDQAMPFAGAIEMIHASTLIHDDMPCMDNDDFRRGKPSCHKQFGDDVALLAGDALYAFSFQTLLSSCKFNDADAFHNALTALICAAGPDGVFGGQILDKKYESFLCSEPQLIELHSLKTGALFSACARIPLLLSRADIEIQKSLMIYIRNIGIAFQIKDDLLDFEGCFADLGKATGADGNKSTFVSVLGIQKSKEYLDHLIYEAKNSIQNIKDNDLLIWICDFVQSRTH